MNLKDIEAMADEFLAAHPRKEREEEYPILTRSRLKTIRAREKPFSPDYLDILAYGNYEVQSNKRSTSRCSK